MDNSGNIGPLVLILIVSFVTIVSVHGWFGYVSTMEKKNIIGFIIIVLSSIAHMLSLNKTSFPIEFW